MHNEIKNFSITVESKLQDLLKELTSDSSQIIKVMQYSVLGGGKRFRPFLMHYLGNILNANSQAILHLGACVELMHTYTLVHDDLPCMDNDDLRRGKPSAHKAFSESLAVLSGDALQSQVFMHLSSPKLEIMPTDKLEIIYLVSMYAGTYNLISGQVLDLQFTLSGNTQQDIADVLNIHLLKTAKMFALCGAIVCKIANVKNIPSNILNNDIMLYCQYLGLIWQIIDDYKDKETDKANNKAINIYNVAGTQQADKILNNFVVKINKIIDNLNTNLNLTNNQLSNLLQYILSNKTAGS